MASNNTFTTADLIDIAEHTPSCETQFITYGQRSKFSGQIRTIRCHHDNALIKQTLNSPAKGEVLVIDGSGSLYSALVGDLIATAAQKNNWAGLIVYGAIRDSTHIRQMDFCVKALGTNPRKSSKKGTGEIDISVFFGNCTFTPGHYLYSDEDGILVAEKPLTRIV